MDARPSSEGHEFQSYGNDLGTQGFVRRCAIVRDDSIGHFLVDIGFHDEASYCEALLQTTDFLNSFLQAHERGHANKAETARALAQLIVERKLDLNEFIIDFCRLSRRWLAFVFIKGDCYLLPGTQGDAFAFLTKPGAQSAWFGPFEDDDTSWYIFTRHIPHLLSDGTRVYIRWHAIVEVRDDLIAIHWNSFQRMDAAEDGDPITKGQFPFWNYVPDIFGLYTGLSTTEVEHPDLHTLTLHTMLDLYEYDPDYEWKHRKIRAEHDSVALNASSGRGGIKELDITGIRKLTNALAASAAAAVNMSSATSKIENALLRTILHEWGAKSYEFELSGPDDEGEPGLLAHLHVYFGVHAEFKNSKGQDKFAHVLTWKEAGGSTRALKFLVDHLRP